MSIALTQTLSDTVMRFDTIADFNRYYDKHRDAVDSMPTRGLNIKYQITGHKLGRKHKELQFIAVAKPTAGNQLEAKIDEVYDMLVDVMEVLKRLK